MDVFLEKLRMVFDPLFDRQKPPFILIFISGGKTRHLKVFLALTVVLVSVINLVLVFLHWGSNLFLFL